MRKLTSRTARSLIGTAVFLGIGVFLYIMACRFLKTPSGVNWATGAGMDDVRAHKNKYDVVFVGTSTAIANVNCQELYQSFGIAAVNIGEPEQPVFLSKYTLMDMFRSQSPEIVVLDAKALFYSAEHDIALDAEEEDFIYHRSIDAISSLRIKKQALDTIRALYPERYDSINLWEYFSVMYSSHTNWETLDYRNYHGYDITDCMNGNVALSGMEEGRVDQYAASDPEETEEIEEQILQQVREIDSLCREKGAQLVLTSGYNVFTRARHKAVDALAQELGVPYLDFNEISGEIGFDYATDIVNFAHFNLNGAVKWTMYLGNWLKENYALEDRREDSAYAWYETQRKVYDKKKRAMEDKLALVSSLTLDDYLAPLCEADTSDFCIFITTCSETPVALTDAQKKAFGDLGFDPEAICGGGNYAGTRVSGKISEASSDDPLIPAALSGTVRNMPYSVTAIADGESRSSVLIEEKEKSQRGDGINIVVFSQTQNSVASTVYFDTQREENPVPRRRKVVSGSTVWITKETAPNVWVTEETQS